MISYYDATDAGKKIGCDRRTVCRVAKNVGVGIFVKGRLVAIDRKDVATIKSHVKKTPGNPEWIAMGKKNKKRRLVAS